MNGQIFPDSANVLQDQAKILFNYYRQAAERVVSEEERIEGQIASLQGQMAQIDSDISSHWWLMLLLYFPYLIYKNNKLKEKGALEERVAEFRRQYQAIFRDYRVTRLGVAYVPVAEQVKYQDKSFIVDLHRFGARI